MLETYRWQKIQFHRVIQERGWYQSQCGKNNFSKYYHNFQEQLLQPFLQLYWPSLPDKSPVLMVGGQEIRDFLGFLKISWLVLSTILYMTSKRMSRSTFVTFLDNFLLFERFVLQVFDTLIILRKFSSMYVQAQ